MQLIHFTKTGDTTYPPLLLTSIHLLPSAPSLTYIYTFADSEAAEQYSEEAAPSEVSDDDASEDEQKAEAAVVESEKESNAAKAVPVSVPVSDGASVAQETAMLSQQRRQDNIRAMLSDKCVTSPAGGTVNPEHMLII